MSRGVPEPRFAHGSIARIGILLTNLGTPEAPTAAAVRPYLKQFLSDPRVVEIPRAVWWLILNGIILNLRPKQSAAKYAKIWSPEGSPLRLHTERQARLLRGYIAERTHAPIIVEWAMRYGEPSIVAALRRLQEAGCDRVLVIPLYPQYAASTTATTYDAVLSALKTIRNVPELRLVKHFHDHPGYIEALARGVTEYWAVHGRPDKLVMSFHGLPRYTLDRGDPYFCECQKTGRLLGEALGLSPDRYQITFQSRFGRAEWLKPYTMDTLVELAKRNLRRVDVICPGFVSDCLETLEEIAIENKAAFLEAGGGEFHAIPCLNEHDAWMRALCELAMQHLQGWMSADWSQAKANESAQLSRARALQLGAKA